MLPSRTEAVTQGQLVNLGWGVTESRNGLKSVLETLTYFKTTDTARIPKEWKAQLKAFTVEADLLIKAINKIV